MATGTVDPSAPSEVQSSSLAKSIEMRTHDIHEKGKQLISAIRSPSQRSANPFLVTERHDEKQLCISSKSLHVNDFTLLKTLGTGEESSGAAPPCCCNDLDG